MKFEYSKLRASFQRFLATHRRNPVAHRGAQVCRYLARGFENFNNYDFDSNGEADVLKNLAGQGFTTIFDVGANIGTWARMAGLFFPEAIIHCFEPVPDACRLLGETVKSMPGVVVNPFGLAETSGSKEFKHYPTDLGKSSLVDYPHPLPSDHLACPMMTGDEYLAANGIEQVDFLKMDVEGAEHLVLAGFKNAFEQGRVRVVQFEYGFINIITKFLLADFYRFFEEHGYLVGKIYPRYVEFRTYSFDHEDFIGPNYLAVHRDSQELIGFLA